MAGLTPTGFVPKSQDEIKTDLGSGMRAVFGAAITLIAQSVFGQLIGIISDRLSDLWQLAAALYSASTREGASGIQLDHIGALTGTSRLPAAYSYVNVTCAGVDGTVIAANSVVSIPGVGTRFTNPLAGVISGGSVIVAFRATVTGPYAAPAGTVTQIETPITGWNAASNALDEYILGSDIETDADYRIRQVSDLRAIGSSTVAAIRAKVQAVTNVTDCFVFENVSDGTDAEGLPPHSFETVVAGGTDAAVASVILLNKPAGIATHGTTTQSATDANGFSIPVKFSRPTALNGYVTVNVTADAAKFPTNGASLIQLAIVAYESNYHLGSEFRSSALVPNIFAATAGILESTLPLIGTAPSPVSSATIQVNNRQKVDLDTSRTVVNVTLVNT